MCLKSKTNRTAKQQVHNITIVEVIGLGHGGHGGYNRKIESELNKMKEPSRKGDQNDEITANISELSVEGSLRVWPKKIIY